MASSDGKRRSPGRISTIVVMAVTAVVILAVTAMVNRTQAGGDGLAQVTLTGDVGPAPQVGGTVPDFSATTVDGKSVSLKALRGHPVWVTFGASWCQECRVENPDIEAAYPAFKAHGGEIISVFISEDQPAVLDYVRRIGLTFPAVADPQTTVASAYAVSGIPAHFFIDAAGKLRVQKSGALDAAEIRSALAAIGG